MKSKSAAALDRLLDDLLLISLVNNGLGCKTTQYIQTKNPKVLYLRVYF